MNCPRCGLINPETAQRCDCGYDFVNKSVEKSYLAVSSKTSPSRFAIGAQVVVLVLAGGAVIWGCWMVYVALYPGGSGEFGSISILLAAAVDIPIGLVSLAVRKGHPALRWMCLILSVAALALPFLTKAAWQSHLG